MVRAEQFVVFAICVLGLKVRAIERRFGSISTPGRPGLPVLTVCTNWICGSSNGSLEACRAVRKLDLSHLCFSLNFYFSMLFRLFPSIFPLLTYS